MRMSRKRGKRLRDERSENGIEGSSFPYDMRMTRHRARRLRKIRLLEAMRPPAFPRLMRMSRKRAHRLREVRLLEAMRPPAFPRLIRMTRQRARRLREIRLLEGVRLPAFPRLKRMSRQRKRQMREREELSRGMTQVAAASFTVIYVAHSTPHQAQSSPLTTLTDIFSGFDYMKDARDRIEGRKAAEEHVEQAKDGRLQSERDWLAAQEGVRQAEEAMRSAEESLIDLEQQQSKNRVALQRARDAYGIRTKTASESRQALEEYLPQVDAQREEAERLAAMASERENEYYSEMRLQMLMESAKGQPLSWMFDNAQEMPHYEDRVNSARQEANEAQAVLKDLESQAGSLKKSASDDTNAEVEAIQEISELEQDRTRIETELQAAEQHVLDMEKRLAEARLRLKAAEESVNQAASEEIRAEYELEHFGEGHSFGIGMEYYSWHGNRSGYQLYLPLEVSGEEQEWDWAIKTGQVSSSTGMENGSVEGWTATDISAAVHNDHPVNEVRYQMKVHVPSGPSDVHENANPPEDLARLDAFNSGWNWTPQVEAVHHITERDSIAGRMSWTRRGSYGLRLDELGETVGATVSPGNVWKQEIEYLHAGKHDQFLGILSHQSTTSAQAGEYWYKDGDETALKLFYSKDISPKDSWRVYGMIGYKDGTKSPDPLASNGSVLRQYCGLGWMHKVHKDASWWIMANYMKMNGTDYNYASRQMESDRQRLSLQLGFDCRPDERGTLRMKVERYSMRDAASGNYNGWNSSIMYYRSF